MKADPRHDSQGRPTRRGPFSWDSNHGRAVPWYGLEPSVAYRRMFASISTSAGGRALEHLEHLERLGHVRHVDRDAERMGLLAKGRSWRRVQQALADQLVHRGRQPEPTFASESLHRGRGCVVEIDRGPHE